MKKRIAKLLSAVLLVSLFTPLVQIKAKANDQFNPGATVVQDKNSPSGYSVHFVYKDESGKKLESVSVTGPFQYLDPTMDIKDVNNRYTPHEYVNGMYASNCAPGKFTWGYEEKMVLNESTGNYEVSFPITSGSFAYGYMVKYENEDPVKIDDPANPSPAKENKNSDTATGDITNSIVYGKYDSVKQSKSLNLDYVLETTGNKGTYTYVEYTGNLNNHQDLGVYLPFNYDKNRTTPYKVIYASHGGGGNETDWLAMGHIDNIMDNLINNNQTESAIIVTMDNAAYNWDFAQIEDNVLHHIIPYMEENYNVSPLVKDRAFCGLSMGGMTTTHMYFDHPDQFGYFGVFSGTDMKAKSEHIDLRQPVLYTTVGNCDIASSKVMEGEGIKYEDLVKWAEENKMENFVDGGYLYGAHDWFVWAQSFHNFAKDIVWTTSPEDTMLNTLLEKGYVETENLGVTKVSGELGVIEGVYHVDESLQDCPGSVDNNGSSMYFIVDEKEVLLIDAGNGFYSNDFQLVLDMLTKDRTLEVALTHNHGDHVGELKNKTIPTGTKVYMTKADYSDSMMEVLKDYDVAIISEGDIIGTQNYSFEAINLRGHTEGSILFYDQANQLLYSGDAMGSGFVWLMFVDDALTIYEKDMKNLYNKLGDNENLIILPGHAWQQTSGALAPGKTLTMDYVKDMITLLKAIKDEKATIEAYPALGREGDVEVTYNGLKATIDTTLDAIEKFTKKPVVEEKPTTTDKKEDVPNTSDQTMILGLIGIGSVAMVGAYLSIRKED